MSDERYKYWKHIEIEMDTASKVGEEIFWASMEQINEIQKQRTMSLL